MKFGSDETGYGVVEEPKTWRKPAPWLKIAESEDYRNAEPERRLEILSEHSQHYLNYAIQQGKPEGEAKARARQFFETWRSNAIDNGINPVRSSVSSFALGGAGLFWDSVRGAGELIENEARAKAPDRVGEGTKKLIAAEYRAAKDDFARAQLATKYDYKHGISVREEDGEVIVEPVREHGVRLVERVFAENVGKYLSAFGEAGQKDLDVAEALWLKTNPRYVESFLFGKLPQGAGNALGFITIGRLTGPRGMAVAGATSGAESARQSAEAQGANEFQTERSMKLQALVGMTEAFGLGSGTATKLLRNTAIGEAAQGVALKAIFSGGAEGLQEATAGMLNDLVELGLQIDPERNPLDPARRGEEFALGAILGVSMSGLERSDAIVLAKAKKAVNDFTIETATQVLEGSHPALAKAQSVVDSEQASDKQKEEAKRLMGEWRSNALTVINGAVESNAQLREAAREDGIEIAPASNEKLADILEDSDLRALLTTEEGKFKERWEQFSAADKARINAALGFEQSVAPEVTREGLRLEYMQPGRGGQATQDFDSVSFAENPVIAALNTHGKLLSRSRGKKDSKDQSLWDDSPDLRNPGFNSAIYSSEGGLRPDEMAQLLYDDGVISSPSPSDMWAAIEAAASGARQIRKQQSDEDRRMETAETEARRFGLDAFTPGPGKVEIRAGDLEQGARLTVRGEEMTVSLVEEDGTVFLEGGEKYGNQAVRGDELLYVEGKGFGEFLEQEQSGEGGALFRKKNKGTASPLPPGVTVDPIRGKGTKPLRKILFDAAKAIGVNIKYRGVGAGNIGAYYPGNSVAAVRYDGDLFTAAHEVAHAIDAAFGVVASWNVARTKSPFDAELASYWGPYVTKKANMQTRRAEGFAGWLAHWLVNPTDAEARAPLLTAYLKNHVPTPTLKALRSFGDDIRQFHGSLATQKVQANIRWKPETRMEKIVNRWFGGGRSGFNPGLRTLAGKFFTDDLAFFRDAVAFIKGEVARPVRPSEDPLLRARLLIGGFNGKMQDVFNRGMVNADRTRATSSGIMFILEPLDNTTAEGLQKEAQDMVTLMVAERTIEKTGQGIVDPSGIGGGLEPPIDVAREVIAELQGDPARYARLQAGAKRYRQWSDAVLRYMRDKGRISAAQYAAIVANNNHYVMMKRVIETAPGEEVTSSLGKLPAGSKLGSVNSDVLRRFKGSSRTIENPILELWAATEKSMKEADRNEVLVSFVKLIEEAQRRYKGKPNQLGTVGRKVSEDAEQKQVIFRNGKREHWTFDKDIHETLKGLSEVQGLSGVVGDVLLALPRTLRWGVTRFPAFAVRNVIRDFQARLQNSRSGMGRGMKETLNLRGNLDIEALQRDGADHAGHYAKDKINWYRALNTAIDELAKDKRNIILDPARIGRHAVKGYSMYESLLSSAERFNRVAEYRAAYERAVNELGYSPDDAALYAAGEARGLMDFAVAGQVIRVVNQFVPFTNPAVQGLRRTVRSAREDLPGFALRWGLLAVVPTVFFRVLAETLGYADEEEEQPAYLRDLFWSVKLGPDQWLRIPKNFETGVLVSGLNRAFDVAEGRDVGEAYSGYGGSLFHALSPFDETTAFGPYGAFVQAIVNKDMFRQRSIVPPWEEGTALDAVDADGERIRETDRASRAGQAAQWMVESFGLGGAPLAPELADARKVDFLARGIFGSVGDFAVRASNVGRDDTNRIPGLKDVGLFVNSPGYQSKSVQDLFSLAKENGIPTSSKAFRSFNRAADKFFAATTAEERDKLGMKLIEVARETREDVEEMVEDRRRKASR